MPSRAGAGQRGQRRDRTFKEQFCRRVGRSVPGAGRSATPVRAPPAPAPWTRSPRSPSRRPWQATGRKLCERSRKELKAVPAEAASRLPVLWPPPSRLGAPWEGRARLGADTPQAPPGRGEQCLRVGATREKTSRPPRPTFLLSGTCTRGPMIQRALCDLEDGSHTPRIRKAQSARDPDVTRGPAPCRPLLQVSFWTQEKNQLTSYVGTMIRSLP